MAMSSNDMTDAQREYCAVTVMRETAAALAAREKIPYEEALLRFAGSRAYSALFDYATEIWKESADYLLNLYDYCEKR